MFSDVNLNDGGRDVITTSAYQTDFYLTLDRIRFSIPGLNPGFPYLVCKNRHPDLNLLQDTEDRRMDDHIGSISSYHTLK